MPESIRELIGRWFRHVLPVNASFRHARRPIPQTETDDIAEGPNPDSARATENPISPSRTRSDRGNKKRLGPKMAMIVYALPITVLLALVLAAGVLYWRAYFSYSPTELKFWAASDNDSDTGIVAKTNFSGFDVNTGNLIIDNIVAYSNKSGSKDFVGVFDAEFALGQLLSPESCRFYSAMSCCNIQSNSENYVQLIGSPKRYPFDVYTTVMYFNTTSRPNVPNTSSASNSSRPSSTSNTSNTPGNLPNTSNVQNTPNSSDSSNKPKNSHPPNSPGLPNTSSTSNTSNPPDTSNIPNNSYQSDKSNPPDTPNTPNNPNLPDTSNTSDNPNLPDTSDLSNASNASNATNPHDTYTSNSSDKPNSSDTTNTSGNKDTPNSSDTSDNSNPLDTPNTSNNKGTPNPSDNSSNPNSSDTPNSSDNKDNPKPSDTPNTPSNPYTPSTSPAQDTSVQAVPPTYGVGIPPQPTAGHLDTSSSTYVPSTSPDLNTGNPPLPTYAVGLPPSSPTEGPLDTSSPSAVVNTDDTQFPSSYGVQLAPPQPTARPRDTSNNVASLDVRKYGIQEPNLPGRQYEDPPAKSTSDDVSQSSPINFFWIWELMDDNDFWMKVDSLDEFWNPTTSTTIKAGPGITLIKLTVRRGLSTIIFPVIFLFLSWMLTICFVATTILLLRHHRNRSTRDLTLPTIAAFGVSFLFALPAVRNILPGAPSGATFIDIIGLFWNIVLVGLSIVFLMCQYIKFLWENFRSTGKSDYGSEKDGSEQRLYQGDYAEVQVEDVHDGHPGSVERVP